VVDGDPGELGGFERSVIVFDGRDEGELAQARTLWTRYRGQGRQVQYWRQNEGRGWTRQG
jgi:DNA polymerase-3 subunit chi